MSKSITVDRIKLIAEMARQNITGEELAQKSGVSRCSIIKMRVASLFGELQQPTLPALLALSWTN